MAQLRGNRRIGGNTIQGVGQMPNTRGKIITRSSGGATQGVAAGAATTRQVVGALNATRAQRGAQRAAAAQTGRNNVDREFARLQRQLGGG